MKCLPIFNSLAPVIVPMSLALTGSVASDNAFRVFVHLTMIVFLPFYTSLIYVSRLFNFDFSFIFGQFENASPPPFWWVLTSSSFRDVLKSRKMPLHF